MFARGITCIKSTGFPVLYVKRVKGFKKGNICYEISWKKYLGVTSAFG